MAENLDELIIKIKADASNLSKEMDQIKRKVSQDGKEIAANLNFRARLDNSLAKLKITELQSYRDKLQARFNQQLKTNVDVGSINRTKTLISSVNSQLEGLGKTGMSVGEKIIAGFVALGGIRGAFRFIGESVKLFFEQAKAVAGVEQAVRRTGGAAGFTAIQLKAMASELQNITGVGDEEILKGVTKQLLTFTQITGTSFKRAQEAVLDLNAVIAGGEVGGLTSQAIQLGKALEDPIAGVGALSRAGVTFTEEQKKMIASFVRQNDLMSAQDIILKEIENKYGGQAKALAGALGGTKQYAAAVGDLKEAIGGLIANIPGLNWLIVNLTGGMKNITQYFQGAAYEAEQLRLELDNLKTAASQIQVKGIGVGDLKARKEYNNQIIEQNKTEVKLLQAQLTEADKKIRFSNAENDAIANKIKSSLQAIQIAKGENEAYDKQIETIENINKSWDKTGKTLGQVQDRISFLEEQKIDLEVKGIDAKKVQKEIDDLTKYIDTSKPSGNGNADYIKKLEDSLNEYRNKIKLLNAELAKLGDGSSEKKVILTAELSKLQEQLNSEEIKLNLKVGKIDLEGGNIDTEGLMKEFAAETDKNIVAGLQENLDLRLKARQEYIDAVGLLNEQAYNDSKAMIDKEYEDFLAAGVAQEEAQAIHDAKMKELDDARLEQEKQIIEAQMAGHKAIADSLGGFAALAKQLGGEQSAAYKIFASTEATIATYLAATKALSEVPFPFNFVAAAGVVAAGLANVAQINAAHSGGEFIGTSSGVKKLAAGGSFIVPQGFNNDSYPLLVESGERVSVTPAGSVGSQDRLLSEISNRLKTLQVLNKNLISKNFAPVIVANLELDGRNIAKSVVSNINKMQKEGKDLTYL